MCKLTLGGAGAKLSCCRSSLDEVFVGLWLIAAVRLITPTREKRTFVSA